jgi:ATP-dependent Clp protease protease subunit
MPAFEIDPDFLEMKKTPAYEEYTYWKQMKDRVLVFNDGVDEFAIENYILPILNWNREDEGKTTEERKPITLYLNSPGGDIFVGLTLAETIKKSKTPVHIEVLTFACSMGSVILVSGHKRRAHSYANVLIHDGQTGVSGSSNKVKDHMKYIEKKNEQIKKFILDNSKVTAEKYEAMSDREWWLDAQEALELGLIDEII